MSDITDGDRSRSLDKSGLRDAFARRLEAGYEARQRVGRHPAWQHNFDKRKLPTTRDGTIEGGGELPQ